MRQEIEEQIRSGQMNIKKIVEDLRTLADDLEKMGGSKEEAKEPIKEEKKPAHGLEDVRAILAEKSQAGFTVQVRDAIAKFGANKLSEVSAESYDDLYTEAVKIGGDI